MSAGPVPAESVDVVVIGSGAAALFCAVAATAMGLSCTVLEKADKFGGGTAMSAGSPPRWLHFIRE